MCSLPFVSVGYLIGKQLVILLFECAVRKCFVVYYVFSFPTGVYVETFNLNASISGPSIIFTQTFNLESIYSVCDKIMKKMYFEDYDTDRTTRKVWLLNIYFPTDITKTRPCDKQRFF